MVPPPGEEGNRKQKTDLGLTEYELNEEEKEGEKRKQKKISIEDVKYTGANVWPVAAGEARKRIAQIEKEKAEKEESEEETQEETPTNKKKTRNRRPKSHKHLRYTKTQSV